MIPDSLIERANIIAKEESERTGVPILDVIELANNEGQRLAELKGADKRTVLLGTLLMDAWLGEAMKEGKQPEHAEYCAGKAEELLDRFPEVSPEERENILSCVREHHGGTKFHSIESEICCNADCYRFASIRGMFASLARMRRMPLTDLNGLLRAKLEEKWKAITIFEVKEELEPEYWKIRDFLYGWDGE